MNVAVVNLGCKVNRVESDTIAAAYLSNGSRITDIEHADLIVVNTCTVTEEAEKKTRKTVRRVLHHNSTAPVLVSGCATTINPDFYRNLSDRISIVDKHELLSQELHGIETLEEHPLLRIGKDFPTRVGVKVQDGCNHSCTYCIVHIARGKAWSRPCELIVDEIVQLAKNGVKEIVLSGIDLGSYNYTLKEKKMRLADLLNEILAKLDENQLDDVRLRVSSIEPCSIQDDFIELLAHSKGRICRHLHLPLQSGSSRVLKEMNRPYSSEYYLNLSTKLKEKIPGISLTTDIIVGFPGETDDDFNKTYSLAKQVGFSKIHVFRYSKRQGTPAAERQDQITPEIKEQRAHSLLALSDSLRQKYAETNKSRKENVVVEQLGWGMSESYYKIKVDQAIKPGTVLQETLSNCIELEKEC